MNSFSLSIVGVDHVYYQGPAVACTVRTTTGQRTFEAHHEPFASVLVAGPLSIVEEGGSHVSVTVDSGLVRMDRGSCVIIVNSGD